VNTAARHVFDNKPAIQTPEPVRRGLRRPGISTARTVPEDDVRRAALEKPVELENQFWRFLKIRSQRRKVFAPPVTHAGSDCGKRTKVPAQFDELTSNRP